MRQKRRSIRSLLSLSAAVVALTALAVPSLSQTQGGGRESSFTLQQGFETQRNPEFNTDGEDDRRTLSNTDLSYALSSSTRRASVGLTLGMRLRGATGDLDVGETEGFDIDRQRLAFRHRYIAPNAEFTTTASAIRRDIGFIQRLDLIDDGEGGVEVPDDIDDLEGTGTRTSTQLRFAARFGEDRPFGWGVSVNSSMLSYEDVDNSNLEDNGRTTTTLNARFDLNPVLQLTTRMRYKLRFDDGDAAEDTVEYDVVLAHRRAENGTVRAGFSLAQPEGRNERLTLFVGGTQEIDDVREFDFNVGTTIGEDGESRFVGLIDYREALSRTTTLSANLNRQVSDSRDNETVLDTAARLNVLHALSRQSAVSFGVLYAARENFSADRDDAEDLSVSVSYSHALTPDWALSVGASHIWRNEDNADQTTSDQLFFSIGRSWNSRF